MSILTAINHISSNINDLFSICFLLVLYMFYFSHRSGFWKKRCSRLLAVHRKSRTSIKFWWNLHGKYSNHLLVLVELSACFHHINIPDNLSKISVEYIEVSYSLHCSYWIICLFFFFFLFWSSKNHFQMIYIYGTSL